MIITVAPAGFAGLSSPHLSTAMIKTISIFTACLFLTGCAAQKSSTWERVMNAPRQTSFTGNRSAVYADGLHTELTNARVPHKVVTYNYPFHSKFDGAGTAQRTSVIYRDESSPDYPWWLMDELLRRPMWLPTEPVQQQVNFFLRRPVKVVTLRDYSGTDGKSVAGAEPEAPLVTVAAPAANVAPSKPWLGTRAWRTVVKFFRLQKQAPQTVAQPEIGEGPEEGPERPLFRSAGVKPGSWF